MKQISPYLAAVLCALLAVPLPTPAASHREAPLTALDHPADITDFFAFVSYDDPSKVTFLLNVDPLLEPANGPNYFPFDPDVLYTIKIDNNYDAVEDVSFEFRFSTEVRAPGLFTGFVGAGAGIGGLIPPAITSLDGAGSAGFNLRQRYTVTMVTGYGDSAVRTDITGRNPLFAVPSNVGPRTMPNYAALARQGIYGIGNGIRVFAGTVDDPFFIDLGAAFDSLNFRSTAFLSNNAPLLTAAEDADSTRNSAADALSGFNVNCIAIEVPISMVTQPGKPVIGTWGATYRAQMTLRSADVNKDSGGWVQVQRMANPLINELVIGTGDKDKWSRTQPKDDSQFAAYALEPLLARLLNTVFGLAVPPGPRTDLLPLVQYSPVFGDKTIPAGPVADLLRLNTSIKPADASTRSRLGLLAGDSAGFPNGRRVSDDVTDIALRAVAGALVGGPYNGYRLGDGVNTNDVPYQETFPYVAWANSGRNRRHVDPGEAGCGNVVITRNGEVSRAPCPVN